jgi:hypothetical protein
MEINSPPCSTHGAIPRALHPENFEGIVAVVEEIIATVSGVGTVSYSRCPYGYPSNFEGVVRVLEDLNTSISGIQSGGGGGPSASGIVAGSGIYITQSGSLQVINATVLSASGLTITAGSGIYLTDAGTRVNLLAGGQGSVSVVYSGNLALISGTAGGASPGGGASVTVSGEPGAGYTTGDLWFDTNQGRLFVYASGTGVADPAWYQTNAEALALKSQSPPSGTGLNAPPRDGSIWFNTLLGSLFVYDVTTSGWYETGPSRSFAYSPAAPSPVVEGAGWLDSTVNILKVWDGVNWTNIS